VDRPGCRDAASWPHLISYCSHRSAPWSAGFDAIVIGAGHAGPSFAFRLGDAGMKVALIERKLFPTVLGQFKPGGQ
jgi:thioredoxin reductase